MRPADLALSSHTHDYVVVCGLPIIQKRVRACVGAESETSNTVRGTPGAASATVGWVTDDPRDPAQTAQLHFTILSKTYETGRTCASNPVPTVRFGARDGKICQGFIRLREQRATEAQPSM